jgi:L-arabinose transport system substrate-binding protein
MADRLAVATQKEEDTMQQNPGRSRGPRKRWAAALAALAIAAVAVAACGSSGDAKSGTSGGAKPKDLKFAYLAKQADVPYFVQQLAAAKAKASALGVKLTTQDLQLDTGRALDSMDTVISQGFDGIVIVVPDQQIGPAVIRKAQAAKIPLIASDDIIKGSDGKPAPYVGLDNAAVGGQVGKAVADLYAKAPWKDDVSSIGIASVELKTLDVCNQRTDGAKQAFFAANPSFPKSQVVPVPYDGSTSKAIDGMSTVITAHPKYKHWLVWSCNDAGVQGAVRALERANVKAADAIGVGLDGSLACDEFKRGTTSFVASLLLDPANEGRTSIQELYDYHVHGKPIPARVDFPGTYVDRSNIHKVVSSCK